MERPSLSVVDFSFAYEASDRLVLDRVSLEFFPGEVTLIAGRSGCGKSTLAACMAGLVPDLVHGSWSGGILARRGSIEASPFESATAWYSTLVGLVSQNPEDQLVSYDVKEELAFGIENLCLPAPEIRARVHDVATWLGIQALLDAPIDTLSGGEKQLVSIASQLVMGQAVLILDEPTAFLDGENRERVLDTIASVKATVPPLGPAAPFLDPGLSVIIIDHDIEHVGRVADRIITMSPGGSIAGDARVTGGVPGIAPPPPGLPLPAMQGQQDPVIVLDGVDVTYGDTRVLENVSMDVRRGEILGVSGSNGCGKTTLLRTMAGIIEPARGVVRFEHAPLLDVPEKDFYSRVGFIFQNPEHQLFCQTALDEITYSPRHFGKPCDEARVAALLAMVDDDPATARKNPFLLSWGQKRRLNIASALAHGPGILFLDEPFIGHDAAFKASITATLQELNAGGMTIVLVSHDAAFLRSHCHRVARIAGGRVVVQASRGAEFP